MLNCNGFQQKRSRCAMRFTVPFLLALCVFTATVLGANLTSFTPSDDLLFDIVSGADSIAFRLENGFGLHENAALPVGGLLLALPATFAFHIFRMIFGGSSQALRAEGQESERGRRTRRDTFTRTRAGERALPVNAPMSSSDELNPAAAFAGLGPTQTSGRSSRVYPESSGGPAGAPSSFGPRVGSSEPTDTAGFMAGKASVDPSATDKPLRPKWSELLERRPNWGALRDQASGLKASLKRTRTRQPPGPTPAKGTSTGSS